MGFYSVIIDSPPFAAQLIEAVGDARQYARSKGEYAKADRLGHLEGQLRDVHANTGGRA